jgi:3-hydroxy-9,10-secoandrosta-1,3,5(10)-triene-9,17-dione monooxygenase
MRELYDAGLLRVYQPKRYGGLEMEWPALPEAARIIASACPSTAWIVAVVGGHATIIGRLPKKMQDEAFSSGVNQLFVTASAQTTGTVTRVRGGYRLNGVWRFASGADHATWFMVHGEVLTTRGRATGEIMRVMAPAREVRVVDTWHVAGLRGTGSKDLAFDNLFIPESRAIPSRESFDAGAPGAKVNPGCYLYDVPFMPYFAGWILGPILGAAEGAYAAYRDATRGRIGAMTGATVAEMATVQERLAESAADIRAATLVYDASNALLHAAGRARRMLTIDETILLNRDRAYVARLCLTAVQRLVRQMGAVGIYDTNPVQRFARDILVAQTQLAVNWDQNLLPFGRRELGLLTGNARIDERIETEERKPGKRKRR